LDKVAHFVMYGVLGALATFGWVKARRSARPAPKLLWVVVLAMSIGMLDELHQRSVPERSADVYDWIADALGVAVASTLILRYTRQGSSNAV
jgi:VanZ family protein